MNASRYLFLSLIALLHTVSSAHTISWWQRIRTCLMDDLEKADYYLDSHAELSPALKDKILVLIRSGFRQAFNRYSKIEKKYGNPSSKNSIRIIEEIIDDQILLEQVLEKAIAKGIKHIVTDEIYERLQKHDNYQENVQEIESNKYRQ